LRRRAAAGLSGQLVRDIDTGVVALWVVRITEQSPDGCVFGDLLADLRVPLTGRRQRA